MAIVNTALSDINKASTGDISNLQSQIDAKSTVSTDTENGYIKINNVSAQVYNDTEKVDKYHSSNVVYATDASGNQTSIIYSSESNANQIIRRDANSTFNIPDPPNNYNPATKKYVDDGLVGKQDKGEYALKSELNGKQDKISVSGNKVLVSDSNGAVSASTITTTQLGYLSGVTSSIQTQLNGKQATLQAGTNIKNINGNSILGSGNIEISGGGGQFVPRNPCEVSCYWDYITDVKITTSASSQTNGYKYTMYDIHHDYTNPSFFYAGTLSPLDYKGTRYTAPVMTVYKCPVSIGSISGQTVYYNTSTASNANLKNACDKILEDFQYLETSKIISSATLTCQVCIVWVDEDEYDEDSNTVVGYASGSDSQSSIEKQVTFTFNGTTWSHNCTTTTALHPCGPSKKYMYAHAFFFVSSANITWK